MRGERERERRGGGEGLCLGKGRDTLYNGRLDWNLEKIDVDDNKA